MHKWSTALAKERIRLYADAPSIRELRRKRETAIFFKKAHRLARDVDKRGVLKYERINAPEKPDVYEFNAKGVLDSIFPRAYDEFQVQGTINVDMFTWWENAGLLDIFLEEMEMYRHHYAQPTH